VGFFSILQAAPANKAELEIRGVDYDVKTITIVAVTYVVTVDEILYEVKCDKDKWGIDCDYEVR